MGVSRVERRALEGAVLAAHLDERREGADYSSTENWQAKVVVDGRLMTGQNPASAGPMAKELLAALKKLA